MARDLTKLHPKVQELAKLLVSECRKRYDIEVKVTDCVRTKEEQNGIDASRTKCKYPKSYHNWGIAFDICRNEDVDKDGKISDDAYNGKGDFFEKVGKVGESLGLVWGGNFKSFKDLPHFEWHGLGTVNELIIKYETPARFFKAWRPTEPIKAVESPKTPAKNDKKTLHVEVTCKVLNLRKSPSWESHSISGTAHNGDTFEVRAMLHVGSGIMYQLTNGKYITASEKYVKTHLE